MESSSLGKKLKFKGEVARCLLDPKFKDTSGVFAEEKCFNFAQDSSDKRSDFIISVGLLERLNTVDGIHAFGCRTAANANNGIAQRRLAKGQTYDRENGVWYIGSYIIDMENAQAIPSDVYILGFEEYIEHEETAHWHLYLKVKEGVSTETKPARAELSDKRLDIIRALMRISFGPLRHVCPEDIDYSNELNEINIPVANEINA